MIQGRCPICGRSYTIDTLADLPTFPFCSDRCRLIDLGRWIDGKYAIPAEQAPPTDPEAPAVEDEGAGD